MKNTLKLDHDKQLIIMDRTFAKLSLNTRSEEYDHLQRVRQDYPYYTVVMRRIRKNDNKKTYKGLTYDYMEDYILTHGTPEERKKNLLAFSEKRLISECHGRAFRYPVIKSWFLETYPEIAEFGVNDADIIELPQQKDDAADDQKIVDIEKKSATGEQKELAVASGF